VDVQIDALLAKFHWFEIDITQEPHNLMLFWLKLHKHHFYSIKRYQTGNPVSLETN